MLVLDHAAGLLDHHFGDLYMATGRFIKGAGDDFALDGARHLGDFLGAFIDQQYDEIHLGVI